MTSRVADRADFGCLSVGHGVHQGANAGLDEVDEAETLPGTIERLPVGQRHTVKMREKPLIVLGRQQTEQSVCRSARGRARRHHGIVLLCCVRWVPTGALWGALSRRFGRRPSKMGRRQCPILNTYVD